MNGLKRYIRPGLVLSVIGHLAALTSGLFLVGASALHTPPPEAMVVEVVTPDELQRAGHPSATPATAPTAGATIATESDPAAGGPSAASAGTGSDPGRAGTRREDRARKARPIFRAATCCISAIGTETRTAQYSRRGRRIPG